MVQAAPEYRAKPQDILKLNVKNKDGNMVSISSILSIQKVYGPEQVTRYNMYPSAIVNGEPQTGFSSGQAINAIKDVAEKSYQKATDMTGLDLRASRPTRVMRRFTFF